TLFREYRHAVISIIMILALVPTMMFASADTPTEDEPWEVLDQYSSSVYLSPGEIASFHFDPDLGIIVRDQTENLLPDTALQAIEKVPEWTRVNLTRTFLDIGSSKASVYGQLILDCSDPRFLDELSFSISHTPPEVLKRSTVYPQVFMDNVEMLYENDQAIDYADIVDFTDHSTVRYWVNESDVRTSFDLPIDIYYWYIVHPKITDEDPTYINPSTGSPSSSGEFWRDYIFDHADSSYPQDTSSSTVLYPKNATPPRLSDVLSGVDTLWNGESYKAPGGYLNNGTGNRRPFDYKDHAVEKVSNWVEKTLPLNVREESDRIANPSRSVQPVRISRNHYGNCGELQDLTIAAARASLIPARGILNTGEDHVWSEFWERGWHHWDNYWSDGGTGIDVFGNYDADFPGSWGRELSTVFSWRGDDYAETVTGNYSDTALFKATVLDVSGRPVDGARVLLATENYYNPEYLTISTWGHTDTDGEVSFDIGDSRNYWSQSSCELGEDPADSGGNLQVTKIISDSQTGNLYTHTFNMPDRINRPSALEMAEGIENGEYLIHMEFDVQQAFLHGKNFYTDNTFSRTADTGRQLDLYLTDSENYQKIVSHSDFRAYEMEEEISSGMLTSYLTGEDTEHVILSNMGALNTEKLFSLNVTVYSLPSVLITSPGDGTRVTHTDIVKFTGAAHSNMGLDTVQWNIDDGEWIEAVDVSGDWSIFSFNLDTAPLEKGEHKIDVKAITTEQKYVISGITIRVEDDISPEVAILSPSEDETVIQGSPLEINGSCWDDYNVGSLTLTMDNEAAQDITLTIFDGNWSLTIETEGLWIGEHDILVCARDPSDHEVESSVTFYLTEIVSPDVSILSPENNTIIMLGDSIKMEGLASDNVELRSLNIFVDTVKIDRIPIPKGDPPYWDYKVETVTMSEGAHVIEVRAEDMEGNMNSSRLSIVIDGTPPELNIIFLETETTYAPEGVLLVKVEARDLLGIEGVRLVFDRTMIIQGDPVSDSTWEMELDISSLISGRYNYYVEATDVVGLVTRVDGTFNIDSDAPSIYSYVKELETFSVGDIVYLNGSVSDGSGISLLTISLDENIWNLTGELQNGVYSFAWNTSNMEPGNYTFEIKAIDSVGNEVVLFLHLTAIERTIDVGDDDDTSDVDSKDTKSGAFIVILFVLLLIFIIFIGAALLILLKRRNQANTVPQVPPMVPYPGMIGPSYVPQGLPVPTSTQNALPPPVSNLTIPQNAPPVLPPPQQPQ
ncbi:MAG: Ig-like domain-containing protein, partial [Candidatus Thermoplasmatota archaeon]|nr:Ig-like domain-containing protein [Candidatus Thermoplasmatota archaeon]